MDPISLVLGIAVTLGALALMVVNNSIGASSSGRRSR